jgi:hypothetical protein
MSHPPVFTKRCCKLVRDHFADRRGPREPSPRQAWPVDYAWAIWNGAELLLIFQNYVTDVLLQPLTADKSRRRIELNSHFVGPKRFVKTLPGGRALAGTLAVFAEFERDILRDGSKPASLRRGRKAGHTGNHRVVTKYVPQVRALGSVKARFHAASASAKPLCVDSSVRLR